MTTFSSLLPSLKEHRLAEEIDKFDLSMVMRRFKQKNPDLDADYAEDQYKLFMYLCCVDTSGYLPVPNNLIDEVWHNHLMFTKEYNEFCRKTAGRFLHHTPPIDGFSEEEVEERWKIISSVAKQHFGEYPFDGADENGFLGCGHSCPETTGEHILFGQAIPA